MAYSYMINGVGRLSIPTKVCNQEGYTEQENDKGFKSRKLYVDIYANGSRNTLEVFGGYNTSTLIYLRDYKNKENFQIPFSERGQKKHIDRAAIWNKKIIDLEKPNRRYALTNLLQSVKDGKPARSKDLVDAGYTDTPTEKELEWAIETSNKLRKEYLHNWDFIAALKKVLDSEKYKNQKFKIAGEMTAQYDKENQRWYSKYSLNRVYLADENEKEFCELSVDFLYGADSLDISDVEESGKYRINGWVQIRDTYSKTEQPMDFQITLMDNHETERDKKATQIRLKRFKLDRDELGDSICKLGIVLEMKNGSDVRQITEDDLTEEQKDAIFCGDITLEEIRKELNGSIRGEWVSEYRFSKLMRGYSNGYEETVWSISDMEINFADEIEIEDLTDVNEEDDDIDLDFGDEDDLFKGMD